VLAEAGGCRHNGKETRSPRTEGVELADELLNILEQRLHLAAQVAHEPALDDREQA